MTIQPHATPNAKTLVGAIVAGAALLAAAGVQAQTPQPAAAIYIQAGRLLDRPGTAPRGPTTIIVRDGKIAELRDGHVAAPAGAQTIDLRNSFVLPGLIDAHVHLGDGGASGGMLPRLGAYRALENARVTLQAGFTTVRNIGDGDGTTMALREAIKLGWVSGPRIIDAGQAITSTLGHGDPRVGRSPDLFEAIHHEGVCDGADECRRAVRRQIALGADVIKIVVTGLSSVTVGPDRGAQMTPEEVKAVIDTAHAFGRKVAAHAHGGVGLQSALSAGLDSVEHGTLMSDDDIAALKKSGAYYVPTLSTASNYIARLKDPNITPEARAVVEARMAVVGRSAEKAAKAGVPLVLGTDAGFSVHGENALELDLLTQHGLTPMQAIVAGTTNAAKLLGVDKEVGSIEPSKSADIIAVRGDPLQDINLLKSVGFVMRAGAVYKSQ